MKDSGITWIDKMPSHWSTARLKHITLSMKSGGTPTSSNEALYADNGTPWVAIGDMRHIGYIQETQKHLTKAGIAEKALIVFPQGTLLYSIYASIGKVSILKVPAAINQAILALVLKDNASQDYVKYLLVAMEDFVPFYANGNTQFNLNAGIVANLPIVVPPLPEQQTIAAFLDKKCHEIDEMVSLQERIIEQLMEYKQSVITEAVCKGLNPDVQIKDSGIEWIGEVPEHWKYYRIKYNTFLKGRIGWQGLNSNDFIDEGYCLITGTDFDNRGGINWNTCYRISKERFDEDVLLHVKEGDLLMTKDGTVGKMAYIKHLPEDASLNSHLLIIRQVSSIAHNRFLYWVMLSDVFKKFISVYQTGSIMSSISQETLGYFSCFCPSFEEQNNIADYLDEKCSEIDTLISLKQSKIEALKEYKKSIIYEYITGKKEVSYGE